MKNCPDDATLVALEEAVEWEGAALVEHVAQCADCRVALQGLERIREHTRLDMPLEDEQVDRVMAAVRAVAPERTAPQLEQGRPQRHGETRFLAAFFALAFLTVLAGQLLLPLAAGVVFPAWGSVAMAAVSAALGTAWFTHQRGVET